MDPTQKEFPLLSFLLFHLDPNSHSPLPQELEQSLRTQFPHLNNPKVLSSLTQAIPTSFFQTQFLLKALGPRPDPDAVSTARIKMTQVQESGEVDKEVEIYKAVVRMEEMHEEYARQLREAEDRLVGIYRNAVGEFENDEVNGEVVAILKAAESGSVVENVDLSGRQLRLFPEAFGRLHGLLLLNLSHNQLEVIPDSIAGLVKLEELDVSSNLLVSLPDSVGLLRNLKVLNVSGNKLNALPESVALCSSLVDLDASFNNLMSLPTNIGYGLVNLERLSIQLNKIRFLPPSICEMKSLRYLDVHFNELRGLPLAIGRLTNLEVLNLSSNFSDLTELPETIGDLTNLTELNLSNNQIRALPHTFGRLENLNKLNLDENPLIIPPKEIVHKGVQAIREFMQKGWLNMLAEEQQRTMQESNQQQAQTGWLAWGTSMLNNFVSGVSESVSGYIGGTKAPRDPYLDQQL
ncbi:hypothetical protein P3X46_017665 [Hevea brasiliensis]|uniref:Plant intracellular Ras-group-related LRR protein 3 n=1 Tax=Hevea brasiliensis TaxID=3981 RepID=A0ABQ9LPJ4_HEVBR|nr:plant intracellular Ras-group-related LRR protein 3-like [Hevea brasiliensis]KAJ9169473.1 hypothetical protein P3X46_017665 [Hevea brasiliensis]